MARNRSHNENTRKQPSLEEFGAMCEQKAGNITEIAKGFKISRQIIYKWFENYPEFKEVYDNVEESKLDFAESQLYTLMKGIPKIVETEDGQKKFVGWYERPSEVAILFTLKTKGKKRGYIERQEVDHNIKELPQLPPINITVK